MAKKKRSGNSPRLFQESLVAAQPGSGRLFDVSYEANASRAVTCLGREFENDEARRAYFTEELRKKLQDADFRKIEGFPIGSDEDILNLSDPPFYTACPNPWIAAFIAEWESQKPEKPAGYVYHREPFAADVSEGKNDPIYNAHSYHTKVPHKAIMRYILHYTEPGDIVFDGFCGTGMTGVAAQLCGDRDVVMSLGYQVKTDGTILQQELEEDGKRIWKPISKLGSRHALLNDLSPAATFIAYNYNAPIDVDAFEKEAVRIITEVENECGWMYETKHTDGSLGKIGYTVWSDVFICPECAGEVVFWESALNSQEGKVNEKFPCPNCNASLSKRNMERAWIMKHDSVVNTVIRQAKQVPVLINYTVGNKRFEKKPDDFDIELIHKIENSVIPYWFPIQAMMFKGEQWGDTWRAGVHAGITHVHHFYTKRNLWILAACWSRLFRAGSRLPFLFTASQRALSRMASIAFSYFFNGGGGFVNAGTKGTLYVSSTNPEVSVFHSLRSRLRSLDFAFAASFKNFLVENKSATAKSIAPDCSIDYVFIDPPFGANIMYSELNFLWKPWLRVVTNNCHEAIESASQNKQPLDYRLLMTNSFREAYRVLKPGHWMTIEFSNTKASVWNNIQTAITEAGFVVANVSAFDKKQGSFKAYTTPTAVKQDLVISAYKPNGGFEERFQKEAQTEEGVWDFVRTHLKYLPITKRQGALLQFIPERDPRILFDQMVAFYVRKGYPVPISSQEFQAGLGQRFIERDGMFYLTDQAAEYDKKKAIAGELQEATLFVFDESSAIQWLRQLLKQKPQPFSDINPQFMLQLGGWKKNEAQLDLRDLLNQNFLCYDGKSQVPEQIHAYLSTNWKELRNLSKDNPTLIAKASDRWYVPDPNKAGDLEKLRERALLKEFEEYKQAKKKLKVFRVEAVRAGFKKAWQDRDYPTIVAVAEKIPNNVLEEDPKLLMWYDQAVTRMGDE